MAVIVLPEENAVDNTSPDSPCAASFDVSAGAGGLVCRPAEEPGVQKPAEQADQHFEDAVDDVCESAASGASTAPRFPLFLAANVHPRFHGSGTPVRSSPVQ